MGVELHTVKSEADVWCDGCEKDLTWSKGDLYCSECSGFHPIDLPGAFEEWLDAERISLSPDEAALFEAAHESMKHKRPLTMFRRG